MTAQNPTKPLILKTDTLALIHQRIRAWYQEHGRHHLPWRLTDDPYAIYLSEVMLQQTQVATVLSRFYVPFLTRFPTLTALANASPDEVVKAWEGLGYYSRARNLHRAAQMSGGTLPRDVDGLLALPGIGRNTAHAVAAFAYRLPVPVMEANVKRVLHRVLAAERLSEAELWEAAERLLDRDDPFTHNQAMMDIGSRICTPRAPACLVCPLNLVCAGQNEPERFPAKKVKKAVPVRRRIILAVHNVRGDYYLMPRTTRLLGGLYGFPEFDAADGPSWNERPVNLERSLGSIGWTYSHFRLEAEVYTHLAEGGGDGWYSLQAITCLPLSGADKKVLALLS